MDSTLCNDCRSLSRSLTFISFFCIALLSVTYAKNLPEQTCRPRPTVVVVDDSHGFKPYHVQLHRCSGTCKDTSPKHKACVVSQEVVIKLDVVDPTTNKETVIDVTNHTSCDCRCNVQCNVEDGQFRDDERCTCFNPNQNPTVSRSNKDNQTVEETEKAVLPYKIGMAVVGFFALCVLLVDMIMCSKHMGVLHAVKKSCCASGDKIDGQGTYNMNRVNSSSTKGKVVRL